MILQNAIQRLVEIIQTSNKTKEKQEVTFIYNELLTNDTIVSVF